jgi:cyclase
MKENMFYGASNFIFENARRLRNNVTDTEMNLWDRLKERFPSYKFRRQHPISIYISDFYCHSLKLIIEIDGSVHDNPEVKFNDIERQQSLEMMGLSVIRFAVDDIRMHLEEVLESIQKQIIILKEKFPL